MRLPATDDPGYWSLRPFLRQPTEPVLDAVRLLDAAVSLHIQGDVDLASRLIRVANDDAVRDYIESMWGSAKDYPDQACYLRHREARGLPAPVPKARDRMPNAATKRALIERDGYVCRYCDLSLVPVEVRKHLHASYPEDLPWGTRNVEQHAAFQALWLQYDHVVPACYGGDGSLDNMVVSCAACNFAKFNYHLAELGLSDPRDRIPRSSRWDGLTRILN